jgi:TPR repeat protein
LQAAVYWYAKAASKGDAHAQYRLGVSYQYGKGTKQDFFLASEYYAEAADQVCA